MLVTEPCLRGASTARGGREKTLGGAGRVAAATAGFTGPTGGVAGGVIM